MRKPPATLIAFVVLVVLALAGTFYFTPKPAPATEKAFTLVLENNALVSGPSQISVNEGDTVKLTVKSDLGGHLMLHGYDKDLVVGGGGEASLTFVAGKSGRFFI